MICGVVVNMFSDGFYDWLPPCVLVICFEKRYKS